MRLKPDVEKLLAQQAGLSEWWASEGHHIKKLDHTYIAYAWAPNNVITVMNAYAPTAAEALHKLHRHWCRLRFTS